MTITTTSKEIFLNNLNEKLGGGNIFIREYKECCFEIRCDNMLLKADRLVPSKMFIRAITKEALACFGVGIEFNAGNSLFWVNL